MQPMTCQQYLHQLDELLPTDEDWKDPEMCGYISWMMIMFLPRRMNQKLIDAGFAVDLRD